MTDWIKYMYLTLLLLLQVYYVEIYTNAFKKYVTTRQTCLIINHCFGFAQ